MLTALWQATTHSACHHALILVTHTRWLLMMNLTSDTGCRSCMLPSSRSVPLMERNSCLTPQLWRLVDAVSKWAKLGAVVVRKVTHHSAVSVVLRHWCRLSLSTPCQHCQVSTSSCPAAEVASQKTQMLTVELSVEADDCSLHSVRQLIVTNVMITDQCMCAYTALISSLH